MHGKAVGEPGLDALEPELEGRPVDDPARLVEVAQLLADHVAGALDPLDDPLVLVLGSDEVGSPAPLDVGDADVAVDPQAHTASLVAVLAYTPY